SRTRAQGSVRPRRAACPEGSASARTASPSRRMATPLSPCPYRLRPIEYTMRIIAGTFRSRQLKSLKGLALRPTSDRLRESLFNVLAERIPGCRFLDVFAGTGAVGIEALSRGAAEAVFIENHSPAATLIQKNLDSLGIRGRARILKLDGLRGLQRLAAEHTFASAPFDIVFLDPPYAAAEEYGRVLT